MYLCPMFVHYHDVMLEYQQVIRVMLEYGGLGHLFPFVTRLCITSTSVVDVSIHLSCNSPITALSDILALHVTLEYQHALHVTLEYQN